jgi:hypothetical protein
VRAQRHQRRGRHRGRGEVPHQRERRHRLNHSELDGRCEWVRRRDVRAGHQRCGRDPLEAATWPVSLPRLYKSKVNNRAK